MDRTFALNFTPTGMVPLRADSPNVPLQPEEIAREVAEAVELGITIVHLHARDAQDAPTIDPAIYARIIEQVRGIDPELVVCVSLSGRGGATLEDRLAPLELEGALKPDMGSLTLSSLNFSRQASINPPDTVRALAAGMLERQILPELEIFDAGMAGVACRLARKGVLKAPHYANIIVGNGASAPCELTHLGLLIRDLPEDTMWSLGGLGAAQLPAHGIALAAGGGIRAGLEDNLHWDAGRTRLTTNLALLRRAHALAGCLGREVMPATEFRQRLQLEPGRGRYGRRP